MSFDERMNQYQGSLKDKDHYTKAFLVAKKRRDVNYDLSKMYFLLEYIIEHAAKM